MTRVIIEKLKDSGYVIDSEIMAINISDEQLLRLGRKYFELASNSQSSAAVTEDKATTSALYESGELNEIVCSTCEFHNVEPHIEPCNSCNNWSNWKKKAVTETVVLQAAKDIHYYCQTHICEGCPLLLKTATTMSCRAGMNLFYPRDWNLPQEKENGNG